MDESRATVFSRHNRADTHVDSQGFPASMNHFWVSVAFRSAVITVFCTVKHVIKVHISVLDASSSVSREVTVVGS